MPTRVLAHDGRWYVSAPGGLDPVFVADGRGHAWPHTGHGLLVALLEPVQPTAEPLAQVRLPDGRVLPFAAAHIRPATNLAAARIGPRQPSARRTSA